MGACPCFGNRKTTTLGDYHAMDGSYNTRSDNSYPTEGYFELKNKSKERVRVTLYEGGLKMAQLNHSVNKGTLVDPSYAMRDTIKHETEILHIIIEHAEDNSASLAFNNNGQILFTETDFYKCQPRSRNILLKYAGEGYCKKQEGRKGRSEQGIPLSTNIQREPERITPQAGSFLSKWGEKETESASTTSYEGLAVGTKTLFGKNKNSSRLGQSQGYLELKNKSRESIRVQILQPGHTESIVVHPDNALSKDFDSAKEYFDLLIYFDLGNNNLCFEHNFKEQNTFRCFAKGTNCLLKFKDKGKLSRQAGRFGKSNEGIPINTNMEQEPGMVPETVR